MATPPIIIKNNSDMKREITLLTAGVSQAKRHSNQVVVVFKYRCVRGDGIKMVSDIMKAFEKFGTGKGFVPLNFSNDNYDVEGHAGVGFTCEEFHKLMDQVYAEMAKEDNPVKSNAPSMD